MKTCTQEGCAGHLGKFDSCLDEVLYEFSMESTDTTGDVDFDGHYAYVPVLEPEQVAGDEVAGGATITVPAGHYIVFTSTQGWVTVKRWDTAKDAQLDLAIAERAYCAWLDAS